MTIRRILAPVRGDGKGEHVLDHAVALARRFKAHLQVLNCQPRPQDLLPMGVVVPSLVKEQITAAAGQAAATEHERLHDLFEAYARANKIDIIDAPPAPPGKVTMSWRHEQGKQARWIARHGRLADLIVVPRPDHMANLGVNTFEAALMEGGRPVLACPDMAPPPTFGEHIAIAWNGSTQAIRAACALLALLASAGQVSVIAVDDGHGDDAAAVPAREFIDYLAEHGVASTLESRPAGDGVGATILAAADDVGADMVIAGAYGRSRGRELAFGGVTQFLIDHATVPLALAH